MELFSTEFLSALLTIIVIDLVLAGDNTIVVGLVARSLPKDQQKKRLLFWAQSALLVYAL